MSQPANFVQPLAPSIQIPRTFANVTAGGLVPGDMLPIPPEDMSISDWLLRDKQGHGVRICLIDSGIDFSHPEIHNFGQSYVVEYDEHGLPHVIEADDLDVVGHGTACASVISRTAPEAQIDSVRVLGPSNKGNGGAFLAALEWAIAERYHIINLSLSTRNIAHRPRLLELSESAASAGTLLVCSAHNSPVESYPWTLASVISVGSHDQPDAYEVRVNSDPPVDFYAGGVGVRVAWLGGSLRTVSGNSFATPAIAASLARLIEGHPRLRTWQYKYLLSLLAANVRRSRDD